MLKHKFIMGVVLATTMVGTATRDANANVYEYPPAQYVTDRLLVKYDKPLDRFFDPGWITYYGIACRTRDRRNYRCTFTVREDSHGVHRVFKFRMKGLVHRGFKHTRIYEDLSGNINLNSSRYITMNPLEW